MRNYPKNGLGFSGVAFLVGMISALAFHSRQAEADVLIGLLDTGVNTASLPAKAKIAAGGWNFVNNNSNTKDTSPSGHGTAMASILGAESGGAGIVVIRTETGTGSSTRVAATAGIEYATAGTNSGGNIRIIVRLGSCSLGRRAIRGGPSLSAMPHLPHCWGGEAWLQVH